MSENIKSQDRQKESDLWKYALLVMSIKSNGCISTTELKEILISAPLLKLSAEDQQILSNRNDPKVSQIIRNLKSHKNSSTNFIHQGYAEEIEKGFKITNKGIEFVRNILTL